MIPPANSSFDELGRYVVADYHTRRPFSSFLPGIAGKWGIPLWAFYVNRGQAVASFGVANKDNPILEFQPANKAYQLTPYLGFRTFLRLVRGDQGKFYQPFAPWSPGEPQRQMAIGMNELGLSETSRWAGIKTGVQYFILPEEAFAGLVRQVTLENTASTPVSIEILDGLPAVIPHGADNGGLKHVSRTLEAWMRVENYQQNLPVYRLKASASDRAQVSGFSAAHFALGWQVSSGKGQRLPVIVDPDLVFGQDTSLHTPDGFHENHLSDLLAKSQIATGKTPCAFFGWEKILQPGESVVLNQIYGHVSGSDTLRGKVSRLLSPGFLDEKQREARNLTLHLTDAVDTQTASNFFDAYVRQTFLDNTLRGGWPVLLGNAPGQHVYHLYSRKHGDLERDYNDFYLPAEFFSSGNGNYRDVNQNRRCDVLLKPEIKDYNIRFFLSLIQLDGYNPLVVKGPTFTLEPQAREAVLTLANRSRSLHAVLEKEFSPGELLKVISDQEIKLAVSPGEFLADVMDKAEPELDVSYGEGFWIDHWTYLLDQIETYLAVYPEKKQELLIGSEEIPFYRSPAQVRPRRERYVLTEQGPRQYHAIAHRGVGGWARWPDGTKVTTSVLGKLIFLAGIKFGTLDPEGMGIEMEAGKPGWYDALNGLPGLFGSSLPESYELLRLIRFLKEFLGGLEKTYSLSLPLEIKVYLADLVELTRSTSDPLEWWKAANRLRESYRAQVYQELSGEQGGISGSDLREYLDVFESRLQKGTARAESLTGEKIPPTYFQHEITEYERVKDAGGEIQRDSEQRPHLRAEKFTVHPLPLFLEGAVRSFKVLSAREEAADLHRAVKASALYDQKLQMLKLNAPLADESHEIGRARAFTPGWLENESVWLHMAYKYLLGLLQAGLYQDFWEEVRQGLPCFQPPIRYGRNPLENSSFLVSSAHPDRALHGAGFVARLSGSTAEFVQMWFLMMAGENPFIWKENQLYLRLQPALPADFFDQDQSVSFNFLGKVPVRYHNPGREDSWNLAPVEIKLELLDGRLLKFDGAEVPSPWAEMIRKQEVKKMEVLLG